MGNGRSDQKKISESVLLTLGCLLSKQRRDTRMNYVNRNDNEFSKEKSQIDAPFYRQYLAKHFNITRVSLQNSGIDQSFFTPDSMIGMTLHFPYFQMNTSGWCPLLAMLYRVYIKHTKSVTGSCPYCSIALVTISLTSGK